MPKKTRMQKPNKNSRGTGGCTTFFSSYYPQTKPKEKDFKCNQIWNSKVFRLKEMFNFRANWISECKQKHFICSRHHHENDSLSKSLTVKLKMHQKHFSVLLLLRNEIFVSAFHLTSFIFAELIIISLEILLNFLSSNNLINISPGFIAKIAFDSPSISKVAVIK